MTKKLHILFTLLVFTAFFSCKSESEPGETPDIPLRRTIIAYVCGDCNLSSYLGTDISEMKAGSSTLPADCRLIVVADLKNKNPYIAEIANGQINIVREYDHDFYLTCPDSMLNTIQWIADQYPSDEYSLIMSGHGTGPITSEEVTSSSIVKLYAYGVDETGEDSKTSTTTWMNIPSIAAALSNLKDATGTPLHFEYIFFDCCCMQTAEVAYELRNYTDYFIAAASEVPINGAPYKSIIPILGADKAQISKQIIDNYINNTSWSGYGGIAIAAVKTSELTGLMSATKTALQSIFYTDKLTLDRNKCIYYYRGEESDNAPVLHDMKHIMRINLNEEAYEQWLPYFNKAVIYSYMPDTSAKNAPWYSSIGINFNNMEITSDTYGGLGMIAPNAAYDYSEARIDKFPSINKTMYDLEWCNAVGWHNLGW